MTKDGKSIVLIGMPGVGKSTIGVILAKEIGYQFLDADLLIQEQEGMLLKDIIATKGHDGFLAVENQVNREVNAKHSVIATGGSAVYGKDAMTHLSSIGTVIYLKLPYEEIEERLGDLTKRGVSIKKGQTLKSLYNERIVLYEKYADITIECSNKKIGRIAEEIKTLLF